MRWTLSIVVVALQLTGCSHVPTFRQGAESGSQGASVGNHIVQGGGGSLWVTITPPAPNGQTIGITTGPDGNMWFTQLSVSSSPNLVGHIDMSGKVTEFILGPSYHPGQITTGTDGALWFTDQRAIGRITTSGMVTAYRIKKPNPFATGITTGSDGNVWFTDAEDASVGKITPQGVITEYRVPNLYGGNGVDGLTNGPDGNIWFTTYRNGGEIGVISPNGHFKFFSTPTPNSFPENIALGGDGNLYFTETFTSKIGEITRDGKIMEYQLPSSDSFPFEIARGYSCRSMWFIDYDVHSRTPQLRQFIIRSKEFTPPIIPPYSTTGLADLYAGPDGNMWVTDSTPGLGNVLISLTHVLTTDPASVVLSGARETQFVKIRETQNKGGSYNATSSDQRIATVGPVNESHSFVITAQGVGSCSVRVSDSIGNSIDVPVTVR